MKLQADLHFDAINKLFPFLDGGFKPKDWCDKIFCNLIHLLHLIIIAFSGLVVWLFLIVSSVILIAIYWIIKTVVLFVFTWIKDKICCKVVKTQVLAKSPELTEGTHVGPSMRFKKNILAEETRNSEEQIRESQPVPRTRKNTSPDRDHEDRSHNLMFFRVPDEEDEDEEETKEKILKLFENHLDRSISSIEEVKRLGLFSERIPRAIVVQFTDTEDIEYIYKNRSAFEKSKVSVNRDLSPADRKINWRLHQYMKTHTKKGDTSEIDGTSLTINGQDYVWDEITKSVIAKS